MNNLCRKNDLIRKIRLISRFKKQLRNQKQLQYTCCPISQKVTATDNEIFLQNHAENNAWRLAAELFVF